MGRERAGTSLHQLIAVELARAVRAHEDSRTLVAECRRSSAALRETVDGMRRRRTERAGARPDR